MTVSIVILNYKSRGHLRQCLRGLQNTRLSMPLQVIVIDNGSHDGSHEVVKREFPSAAYIGLPRNRGYSAGNNVGLRQATGQYLMILNPDVAVEGGAIDQLVQYLERHPKVGMVAPKLVNPDGSTQLSGALFPSFWIPLWRRSAFGKVLGPRRQLAAYFIADWDRTVSRAVGWALGACLLFRRTAFEDVGPLDERYFLYYDDIDYCRRFWEKGWEVHYVAEAEMVHYLSRTSAVNPGLSGILSYATRLHIRSWLQYTAKYRGQLKPPHSM